ncbi:MAG: hypothetical protein Q8O95_00280 [bacterium]|nr:hypothetical protein [bacterium]
MAYNFPIEPEVHVSDIFFRTIAGLFGGGFGTLVLLIGILLSGSFDSSTLISFDGGGNTPFFVFISIVVVYVALLISALASLTFFYYTDRERYSYLLSTLSHVFSLITVIFVVSSPVSIFLSLISFQSLGLVSLALMSVVTLFSVIVMETVAGHKHLLLTLYSSAVALFGFFIVMLLLSVALGTTTLLVVLALPFLWASFGFWQVSFEMIYQWIYQLYGNDFLNSTTRVGSDYIKEERTKK